MSVHRICTTSELPAGSRRAAVIGGRSIVVFNVDGRCHALRNVCPHQGAALCGGTVGGTMLPSDPKEYVYGMEGRVVRCPWHGWEFDLETGVSLSNPDRRVKVYPVEVIDGYVCVDA